MIYEPYASRQKKNSSARDQKCHHELLSVGCFTTGRRDIMDQLPYRLIASILYCDNFVCGGSNISSYSTERQSQKWQHTQTLLGDSSRIERNGTNHANFFSSRATHNALTVDRPFCDHQGRFLDSQRFFECKPTKIHVENSYTCTQS